MTNRHCSDDEKEQLRTSIRLLGMTESEFLRQYASGKRGCDRDAEVERLKQPLQKGRKLSDFDFKQLWSFSEKLNREKKTGYVARREVEGSIPDKVLLDAVTDVSKKVGKMLKKKLAD